MSEDRTVSLPTAYYAHTSATLRPCTIICDNMDGTMQIRRSGHSVGSDEVSSEIVFMADEVENVSGRMKIKNFELIGETQ